MTALARTVDIAWVGGGPTANWLKMRSIFKITHWCIISGEFLFKRKIGIHFSLTNFLYNSTGRFQRKNGQRPKSIIYLADWPFFWLTVFL